MRIWIVTLFEVTKIERNRPKAGTWLAMYELLMGNIDYWKDEPLRPGSDQGTLSRLDRLHKKLKTDGD